MICQVQRYVVVPERDWGSGYAGNSGENVLAIRVIGCGKDPAVHGSRLGEFAGKNMP